MLSRLLGFPSGGDVPTTQKKSFAPLFWPNYGAGDFACRGLHMIGFGLLALFLSAYGCTGASGRCVPVRLGTAGWDRAPDLMGCFGDPFVDGFDGFLLSWWFRFGDDGCCGYRGWCDFDGSRRGCLLDEPAPWLGLVSSRLDYGFHGRRDWLFLEESAGGSGSVEFSIGFVADDLRRFDSVGFVEDLRRVGFWPDGFDEAGTLWCGSFVWPKGSRVHCSVDERKVVVVKMIAARSLQTSEVAMDPVKGCELMGAAATDLVLGHVEVSAPKPAVGVGDPPSDDMA